MRPLKQELNFLLVNPDELNLNDGALLEVAIRVRRNAASSKGSNYAVGAAARSLKSGLIYLGCNVEDKAQSGTLHAETNALGAMITAEGEGACIEAIAIALAHKDVDLSWPPQRTGPDISNLADIIATNCGHCRTMLSQYGPPNGEGGMRMIALQPNGEVLLTTLRDLYPLGFDF